MTRLQSRIESSVRFIRSEVSLKPTVGIILGSGLGDFAESFAHRQEIESSSIPYYPVSTVTGHKGKLVFGKVNNVPVLAFQGRVHFYESGELKTVLYPIRIAHRLGIKKLIVTNAAGGVSRQFGPGNLMLITDQINLTFERLVNNTDPQRLNVSVYDEELISSIKEVAASLHIDLKTGVYCGVKGPSYETAAEVEMVRRIGGDAVGMSTVNEVSLAASLGLRVAGISCITNLATGIKDVQLSHAEVTVVANRVKQTFARLLQGVIRTIALAQRGYSSHKRKPS